jgi:hypothetical protein
MDKTPDSDEAFKDVMTGGAATCIIGILVMGIYGIYQLCITVGPWIISVPVGALLVWLFGHVLRGLHSDNRVRCRGCSNYFYGNMFTEWKHKRSCLPWLTKKV